MSKRQLSHALLHGLIWQTRNTCVSGKVGDESMSIPGAKPHLPNRHMLSLKHNLQYWWQANV